MRPVTFPTTAPPAAARAALHALRQELGVDTVILNRWVGDEQVTVLADGELPGVEEGTSRPWAVTLCARMVDGDGPRAAPNTALEPAYAALAEGRVGAYLAAPLLAPDGTVLGTLCALSLAPASGQLSDGLELLEGVAGLLGALLADGRAPAPRRPGGTEGRRLADVMVAGAAPGEGPAGKLRALLEAAARHLDMTMAYVSRVSDGTLTLERTWTSLADPLPEGISVPSDSTYCHYMLEGQAPPVVRDGLDVPVLAGLGATGSVLRSYVGVPIVLGDGTVHGSFCAFRATPHQGLTDNDVAVVRVMAEAAARILEEELRELEAQQDVRDRLDAVLRPGGMTVVLQPVVDLATGATLGHEALTRFVDRRWPTEDWFRYAARVDDDDRLQRAALEAALLRLPDVPGFLSVNLSARALLHPESLSALAAADPARLVVELTEHERVTDYDRLAAAIAHLREAGLRIAVDDAGAGFASLRHVLRLRPDVVKLDLSLVRGVDGDPVRRALVAALVAFANDTGVLLVGEGVETAAERAALREAGVPLGQGFLLGEPA